jgi:transcription elongation factor GreA
MAQEETFLTPKGYQDLEEELEILRNQRRSDIAVRIQQAKDIGGTVDNAEYDEAKNEQAFAEGRILTLETMLKTAVLIPSRTKKAREVVEIGSTVTVLVASTGKKERYTIVGSAEASPAHGRISNESPVGKAFLGKRVNEEVEVKVPAGIHKFKIMVVR